MTVARLRRLTVPSNGKLFHARLGVIDRDGHVATDTNPPYSLVGAAWKSFTNFCSSSTSTSDTAQ